MLLASQQNGKWTFVTVQNASGERDVRTFRFVVHESILPARIIEDTMEDCHHGELDPGRGAAYLTSKRPPSTKSLLKPARISGWGSIA
jgi:hypothetical protein